MKVIKQFFDRDEIRKLAYNEGMYCIRESNEHGKLDKHQLCKQTPETINALLEDEESMFVMFERK